jgi:hypothetical protein
MNPNRHQEDGSSLTELFSSGVVMRTGSPQEDVIPAIFPDLSRYMSNGKKSCLGGPSTSSLNMMAPRSPFSSRFVGLRQLSDPEEPVSEEEPSLPKSWECLQWERTG